MPCCGGVRWCFCLVWPCLLVSGNALVYGDARVSGDAWVYGDAEVYGNANIKTSPICISGLKYHLTAYDKYVQIGCKFHTQDEWVEIFKNKTYLDLCKNDEEYLEYENGFKFIVTSVKS